MTSNEAKFIVVRALRLHHRARTEPQYARPAREWLTLAAKYARKDGRTPLAEKITRLEQSIL